MFTDVCKKAHHRCLTGSLIRLLQPYAITTSKKYRKRQPEVAITDVL